jgi:hypothetical protein
MLAAGASGFVIEPAVADRYKLPAFGDLSIAGIAGKVRLLLQVWHTYSEKCLQL